MIVEAIAPQNEAVTESDRLNDGGIRIEASDPDEQRNTTQALLQRFARLGLGGAIQVASSHGSQSTGTSLALTDAAQAAWAPRHDTTGLCERLALAPLDAEQDLEREILVAMLASPKAYHFPSLDELESALRIRADIVAAGRRAELDFHTTEVNRPTEFWNYQEDVGFVLNPGKSLIDALRAALFPREPGARYAFSCYRATEYVMLLAIAQELQRSNLALYEALQARWRISPIASRRYHDTFMDEQGSNDEPLPLGFYVPGDRVWFRNPDVVSAEIAGYEGSWVIYLGNGQFTNFWEAGKPFTLESKCLEIYHWRDGVLQNGADEPSIDEARIAQHVKASQQDPAELARIQLRMVRYRDPSGVDASGGCIDRSREHSRWIRPARCTLVLPALE